MIIIRIRFVCFLKMILVGHGLDHVLNHIILCPVTRALYVDFVQQKIRLLDISNKDAEEILDFVKKNFGHIYLSKKSLYSCKLSLITISKL